MSHNVTCTYCGKLTPTGVCKCAGSVGVFLERIRTMLAEPLPCGHDLVQWCDYCATCGECRMDNNYAGDKDLAAELTRLRAIEKMAKEWWKNRRPCSYTEADHLANPIVNTVSDAEKQLALAIAGQGPKS